MTGPWSTLAICVDIESDSQDTARAAMHPDTCKVMMMMKHARPTSVGLRTATVDLFVHAEKQSQGLYHEGREA